MMQPPKPGSVSLPRAPEGVPAPCLAGMPERPQNSSTPSWMPRVLTVLFLAVLVQLPFELPQSIVPAGELVITHLEISLLVLIAAYVSWHLYVVVPNVRLQHGKGIWTWLRRRLNDRRIDIAIVLWFSTLLASAVLAPDLHLVSIKALLRTAAIGTLFWISRSAQAQKLGKVFAVLAVVVAAIGILEGQFDVVLEPMLRFFRPRQTFDDGLWRLTSTFSHANQTAAWLAMSLPFLLVAAVRAARSLWLWTLAFVLVWWALLSTQGRGGIVAGLLVLLAMLIAHLVQRSTRKRAALLLGALVFVSTVRIWTSPPLAARFHLGNPGPAFAASYDCPARLTLLPGERAEIAIEIANQGFATWRGTGAYPYHTSYHLYDLGRLDEEPREGIRGELPEEIPPGATVQIVAPLLAPSDPGLYLVAWDVVRETVLWFTWCDVVPGLTMLQVSSPDLRYEEWYDGMPASARLAWLDRLAKEHHAEVQRAMGYSGGDSTRSVASMSDPSPLDRSKISRIVLWRVALDLFRERPLTGWGPDTFRYRCSERAGLPEENTDLQAHNLYLELLATSGILGLVAWLLILGALLLPAVRSLAFARSLPVEAWAWAACVVTFCLHGWVDSFFGSYELMGFFWIAAGALAAAWARQVPEGKVAT